MSKMNIKVILLKMDKMNGEMEDNSKDKERGKRNMNNMRDRKENNQKWKVKRDKKEKKAKDSIKEYN